VAGPYPRTMSVDPQLAILLQFLEANQTPIHQATPADVRADLRTLSVDLVKPEDIVPVGGTETAEVAGRPARLYRPLATGPHPTLVYFHGGGFVIGDLDTHDETCRRLCRGADATVVSVDYRLSPEHPFPAAVEDCLGAVDWAAGRLHELGGSHMLAVGGDDAGGTLAAVCAQERRAIVGAQLLLYPSTDVTRDYPSRQENGEGYYLTTDLTVWFFRHYLSGIEADLGDPRISPLHGDLAGLAPAVVATAELDPLRDEGEAYAAAMADAGVHVDQVRYDGMIHGFFDMGPYSAAAAEATDDIIRRFRLLAHP
jgi:acetyl esterase